MRVNPVSKSKSTYERKPQSNRYRTGTRKCLTCQNFFKSAHKFNRVCKNCKKTEEFNQGGWMI